MSRGIRISKVIAVNLLVLVLLLVVTEGLSSYFFFAYGVFNRRPIAERAHTEYDEELGWVNLPNLNIQDMYGPGIEFRTNSQRYRNATDFAPDVPAGKIRLVCSGDSFTLGYGVDNDHTWCQLLTSLDERLETVNMGQGGYGIDQSYLAYERNKNALKHDVHVFAFITDDFHRMERERFLGYGRPHLILRDGRLLPRDIPVPKTWYYYPWLTTNVRALRELKSVEFVFASVAFMKRLASPASRGIAPSSNAASAPVQEHTAAIASAIFADLQRASQEGGGLLVLVYLPTLDDFMTEAATARWLAFVRAEAKQHGYLFVDLVEELQKVRPDSVRGLFTRGALPHYSREGNRYVAETLYRRLRAMPEMEKLLKTR